MKEGLVVKCPICRKEREWEGNESRPFCSERCRLIDLGNWASGEYSLPGEAATPPEETEE